MLPWSSIPASMFELHGRGGEAYPIMEAFMEMPPILDPTAGVRSRINRIHNQAMRFALMETMKRHHKLRIPGHFDRWKQSKYKYKRRSRITKILKSHKALQSQADLVKTGGSKREMTTRIRIRIGGSASGGKMTVTGILRWRPGMRQSKRATGVTREVMSDEIARFTPEEEQEAAQDMAFYYLQYLEKNLSGRAKIKVSDTLRNYGLSV